MMEEDFSTSALEEKEFDQKVDLSLWKRIFRYALHSKGIVSAVIATEIEWCHDAVAIVHWEPHDQWRDGVDRLGSGVLVAEP